MFAVLYTFKIKEGREVEFIQSWTSLTALIYQNEGSYGSKLHRDSNGDFVAYALWPDKETWKNAGSKLPNEADEFRLMMKDSCLKIETKYELEEVNNLLKDKPFSS